jgi:O-antigen ligase
MNHTSNYLKTVFYKIDELWQNQTLLVYLLTATLVTLPMKYIMGSLACLLFLLVSFYKTKKAHFSISNVLLLPMLLYGLMLLSLTWTIDTKQTIAGLQKEVLFLLIPLAFCRIPRINRNIIERVLKIYSLIMVCYAIFYFIKAVVKFSYSGNSGVFFYHELVTLQLNAIYVSVFASFAMFYFISKKNKSNMDRIGLSILIIFVTLLSSKNIILVDLILIIAYYLFFVSVSNKAKIVTILVIIILSTGSVFFIAPIRDRFMIEFDTVFVDSSLNNTTEENHNPVYNISLKQAWSNSRFQPNDFFPGTALRVFQIRVFKEILQEENVFFQGFGLDASQDKIKEKVKKYNLHSSYGDFNFHNEYVQIFSELGIFGFLIVLSMLFVTIKNGIINKDFVHIAFSVTMIALFFTESFFSRQRGIIFFIIIYCMFNTTYNKEQKV